MQDLKERYHIISGHMKRSHKELIFEMGTLKNVTFERGDI